MIPENKKEIISKIEKSLIFENLANGTRIDGRKFFEFRQINIIPDPIGKAEGSSFVSLGKTKVLVGVKVSLGKPFPDTPNEGVFVVNSEFSPIASPVYELGPPSEYAIEVARIVDRAIRSAEAIDLEKLVVIPGEIVWVINIDIYAIDDDGNLIDASMIGAISALFSGFLPRVEVLDEEKNKVELIKDEKRPIPIRDTPITFTFAKIRDYLILDPNYLEENTMDSRLTIAINSKNEICAIQKGEGGGFKLEDILLAKDIVLKKANEIRQTIFDQLVKKPRGEEAWNEIRGFGDGQD